MSFSGTDRSGGTRDQGHHGESGFGCCFRLAMDAALVAMIAKDARRQLATRLAVDTSGIDKEISGHILR